MDRRLELKPCPFCGASNDCLYITTENGYLDESTIIFCDSCKTIVKIEENDQEGYNDKTIDRAIAAWNQRDEPYE